MSDWFRIATVRIPKDKRAQFLEVYHHHGWLVEDLHDEIGQVRVWIPEGRLMEVRQASSEQVLGASFLKPGV